jgi:hypothetical protein
LSPAAALPVVPPPAVEVVVEEQGPLCVVKLAGLPVAFERKREPADELAAALRERPSLAAELLRIAQRHRQASAAEAQHAG